MTIEEEQATEIERLEKERNALREENTRLREALKFYADARNYEAVTNEYGDVYEGIGERDNWGDKARAALERREGMTDIAELVRRMRVLAEWQTAMGTSEPEDHIAWEAADALEAQARRIADLHKEVRIMDSEYKTAIASIAELEAVIIKSAKAIIILNAEN